MAAAAVGGKLPWGWQAMMRCSGAFKATLISCSASLMAAGATSSVAQEDALVTSYDIG